MIWQLLNSTLATLEREYFGLLDINYAYWVAWVMRPILISFFLPFILVFFIYLSSFFLMVYRHQNWLRGLELNLNSARQILSTMWVFHGWIWHGHELRGAENIPRTGPAIIIYYHGTVPIDLYYLICHLNLNQHRQLRCVGDQFLFKVPGWRNLMDVMCVIPGTVQSCVEILKEGHVLSISPGGVREALFGDEYYDIIWGQRMGFARVALQANAVLPQGVPVIPMFTENIREAFRTPYVMRVLLRKVYEHLRLPIVPIYGMFPVKLRTHLGPPIFPDPQCTPEQFRDKVKKGVATLIEKHQKKPGSILRALIQRVWY